MTCFENGVFERNDNGLFDIDWKRFPGPDQQRLSAACRDEQSLHCDAATGEWWGDPTPCQTLQIVELDTVRTHFTDQGREEIDQNGGSFSEFLNAEFTVQNPSNCLDAFAHVYFCYPDVESRFSNGTADYAMRWRLIVDPFGIQKQGLIHRHQFRQADGLSNIGTPAGTSHRAVRLDPGESKNVRLEIDYAYEDDADADTTPPSRIFVGSSQIRVHTYSVKSCDE